MATFSRSTIKNRNLSVASGIDKHVPSPITVGGVVFAPADLKAVFTGHNAALDAADTLHKQWTDQLLVADVAGEKANATYQSLRSYLVGQYGNDANAVLHDFGMEAPKAKGPKTVKTKAEAAEKRAATRAARHTMGKNQKKGITGATVAAPASPAAPVTTTPATPPVPAAAPVAAAPPASKPTTVS